MKIGDLVRWSLPWIVMKRDSALMENVDYSKQVGVLERKWDLGWYVTWSDGQHRRVHKEYLVRL